MFQVYLPAATFRILFIVKLLLLLVLAVWLPLTLKDIFRKSTTNQLTLRLRLVRIR
jgi:hypothetical protein